MILWMLSCKMRRDSDVLYAFYASDQSDAQRQASRIVQWERLKLKNLQWVRRDEQINLVMPWGQSSGPYAPPIITPKDAEPLMYCYVRERLEVL